MAFIVVAGPDYPERITQAIHAAKRRVTLAAMVVLSSPQTDTILEAAQVAAHRGVAVHILLDRYSFFTNARPDYLDGPGFKAACAATNTLLDGIRSAGGTVSLVGDKNLNPYTGRYHAKITVVDDQIYSFGGLNLRDDAFTNIDYMLFRQDAALADFLDSLVWQNSRGLPNKDVEHPLSATETLLFDAGGKGESIIYSHACALAARALKVTYISQMAPSGKLAALLRQRKTTYFANRPGQTGMRPDSLAQLLDQARAGMPNHYEGRQYVHAKVILYEMPDGSTALISGSHNYSWRGVQFGTQEIALHSTDVELWRQLHAIVYQVATAE